MKTMARKTDVEDIVSIIAFVYVNRLQTTDFVISKDNWKAVWLTSVDIAQKTWKEKPLRTRDFEPFFTNVKVANLRFWEYIILKLINYQVRVEPKLYAQYYYSLKQAFDILLINSENRKWSESMHVMSVKS